jgi:aspartate kinase
VALVVQKFGGSSVATAERIMAAARRAIRTQQAGHQVIVVVSARGDTTDELIALAHEITEHPPSRELDALLATGEQISIALMAMAIHSLGAQAVSLTGAQVGIVTDSAHTKARIKTIATQRLTAALERGNIVIVAGFQGVDQEENITTLGRGGSDTTAVALAAVMKHDAAGQFPQVDCEIYTDVDGVYTTDPRVVPEAQKIPFISYEEMLELASLGAGVMHSRSIEFAKKFEVPLQVRNSFSEMEGTWIVPETPWMRNLPVCGAALVRDEARLRLSHLPDHPGLVHQIFAALADRQIIVDMIAATIDRQGRAEIGFTVLKNELGPALEVLAPLARERGGKLSHTEGLAKVSAVGVGMRTHTGVAQNLFTALASEGIGVRMVSTSEIKISVLVPHADGPKALRTVHQAFGLSKLPPLPAYAHLVLSAPLATRLDPRGDLSALLSSLEDIYISDVALDTTQGRISVFDLPDRTDTCAQIFAAIALAGIVVDMIIYNFNDEGRAELSFSVPRGDLPRAVEQTQLALQRINPEAPIAVEETMAKVSATGVGMRTHAGVARRMFGALARADINIEMISTSETQVSVVVRLARGEEARAALRREFQLP